MRSLLISACCVVCGTLVGHFAGRLMWPPGEAKPEPPPPPKTLTVEDCVGRTIRVGDRTVTVAASWRTLGYPVAMAPAREGGPAVLFLMTEETLLAAARSTTSAEALQ